MALCPRCARPLELPHQAALSDPHHERCHNRSRPWDAFCMTGPERALSMRYHYDSRAQFEQRIALDPRYEPPDEED